MEKQKGDITERNRREIKSDFCGKMVVPLRRVSFWAGNRNTPDTVYAYVDHEPKDSEYLKDVKGCVTYKEIKEWIKSEYGLKVSSLYVAQIKDKCGIEKRLNHYIRR